METVILEPSEPIVVNKSYDCFYLYDVYIDGTKGPGEVVNAYARFIPYIKATKEMAPLSMLIEVPVLQIFQRIANGETDLLEVVNGMLTYAMKTARIQGKIT